MTTFKKRTSIRKEYHKKLNSLVSEFKETLKHKIENKESLLFHAMYVVMKLEILTEGEFTKAIGKPKLYKKFFGFELIILKNPEINKFIQDLITAKYKEIYGSQYHIIDPNRELPSYEAHDIGYSFNHKFINGKRVS